MSIFPHFVAVEWFASRVLEGGRLAQGKHVALAGGRAVVIPRTKGDEGLWAVVRLEGGAFIGCVAHFGKRRDRVAYWSRDHEHIEIGVLLHDQSWGSVAVLKLSPGCLAGVYPIDQLDGNGNDFAGPDGDGLNAAGTVRADTVR